MKIGPDEPLRYIETSALLRAIVEQDEEAREALRRDGQRVASVLTFAEAWRTVSRETTNGRLSASLARSVTTALRAFERRITTIGINEAILSRVRRPFPLEPVRTFDAIHLATLESLGQPPALITVVTRDLRVERNAKAMGYAVE